MISFTQPERTAVKRLSTSLQIAPVQDLDSESTRLFAIQAQREIDEMYRSYDDSSLIETGDSYYLNRRIFSGQVELRMSVD